MKAGEFFSALKQGAIGRCYLFEGEEEYMKDSALGQLRAGLLTGPFAAMNETVLRDPSADELIPCCETLPMLAERRLVVARDSSLLTAGREGGRRTEKDADQIQAYLKRLPDTVCLVFFCRGKANGTRKIYKEIAKLGGVVQFEQLDHEALIKWIAREMKGYGKQVARATAEKLIFISGKELSTLKAEVAKVCAFAGDAGTVEESDVEAVCTPTVEYRVFDLSDRVAEGRAAEAAKLMNELLRGGEQRLALLALLQRQYRSMLFASMLPDGANIAQALGIPPFAVRKLTAAARRFSRRDLKQAYDLCIRAEYMVKSGQMPEEGALERVIFELLRMGAERKQA